MSSNNQSNKKRTPVPTASMWGLLAGAGAALAALGVGYLLGKDDAQYEQQQQQQQQQQRSRRRIPIAEQVNDTETEPQSQPISKPSQSQSQSISSGSNNRNRNNNQSNSNSAVPATTSTAVDLTDQIDDLTLCKVCYDQPMNTVFINCRHQVCCMDCAELLTNSDSAFCPICRTEITEVIQVYKG